jgi:pentatricopeptide repeat protein
LEALSFLSSVSDDPDFCERAQEIFDSMFKNWVEEDDEDLEPTIEIYNFLVSIYANCGDMKTVSIILSKMENSEMEDVPSADMNTYIATMEGFGKRGNLKKAEEVLDKMRIEYDPTLEPFHTILSLWKKSGDWNSPEKAELLLKEMIGNEENAPSPTTDTFSAVMECFNRNSHRSKSHLVPGKLEDLVGIMRDLSDNGNDDVNPHDRSIVNEQIKSLSKNKNKNAALQAEELLVGMIERFQVSNDEREKASASCYINTINVWRNSKTAESAKRAIALLKLLQDAYDTELKAGRDGTNLKPDNRVYNAVMNVVSRSRAKDKATQAQSLLDQLQSLHDSSNDSDFAPNLKTYNYVISACAFSRGNESECKETMRLMIETFNKMRNSEIQTIHPNPVTFGLFLKGCGNLIDDEKTKQTVVENLFRKCCRDGCVSDFVLDALMEATSTPFVETLLGTSVDEDGIQIPEEWTRNNN